MSKKIETVIIDIKLIKYNQNNPRVIKDEKFKKLCQSIKDFPKMLELRPIVIDTDNIVLGGNMRLKALHELGYKKIPVVYASELTEEQKKEFIVKDNAGYGEWDWEKLLNDWDNVKLDEWGLSIPNWSGGLNVNNMGDNDVNLEEFDPMGKSANIQRVVFLFDGPSEAESYLKTLKVDVKKQGQAWQVNLSTLSI